MFWNSAHCRPCDTQALNISCRLGASIVVNSGYTLPVFEKMLYNPMCFIQYQRKVSPASWDDVSMNINLQPFSVVQLI